MLLKALPCKGHRVTEGIAAPECQSAEVEKFGCEAIFMRTIPKRCATKDPHYEGGREKRKKQRLAETETQKLS